MLKGNPFKPESVPRVLGIPPSHQHREEDSERSSDEARQCEAEAALELSKVAALLLGRSWADGRANRMEWNGIGCGFFWESF